MTAAFALQLAALPSPSSGTIELGPLRLTAYGLMIALGVLAAVEIARRRAAAVGVDPDVMSKVGLWGALAGLLGARAYHVLTDFERFQGSWGDAVKIWEGGLGIPGGILAGTFAGLWVARRNGVGAAVALDIGAPAVPVAQAIGRWGNWFNQELFGAPTTLPWGLEIDPANRPAGYEAFATFHPTFLYESLWLLAMAGVLVWADRRYRLGHGRVFALYVLLYCAGRLWIELLRIDSANTILGLRVNVWTSLLVGLGAAAYLVISQRMRPGRETPAQVDPRSAGAPGPAAVV